MVLYETLFANLPYAGIAAVSAGALRSVAGWLENVLKDGVVDKFEWKQLGGTMIKYFGGVSLLMLGLPVESAVAAMFGVDAVTSAIKSTTETPAPQTAQAPAAAPPA